MADIVVAFVCIGEAPPASLISAVGVISTKPISIRAFADRL